MLWYHPGIFRTVTKFRPGGEFCTKDAAEQFLEIFIPVWRCSDIVEVRGLHEVGEGSTMCSFSPFSSLCTAAIEASCSVI